MVTGNCLVTITGPGGSGKTRFAVEVASRLLTTFDDGVWFVDLARLPAAASEATLAGTIGAALGLSDEAVQDPTSYLAGKALLLVLDNCEHVVAAAASVVHRLLDEADGLVVLATSREVLAIDGEVAYPLSTLGVPGETDPVDLQAYDSTALFLDRARRARPGYEPSSDEAAAIADIARRLDGLPLALELAASQLRALSARDIAQSLHERLDLPARERRSVVPRQQTVRASIDWSVGLLSDAERAVLRRLAVFVTTFDLSWTAPVVADADLETGDVLELLTALVEKSLVVRTDNGFRLLDTIRRYALELLRAAGEEDAVRERLGLHFMRVAAAAAGELWFADGVRAYETLTRAEDDVRAVLRRSAARGEFDRTAGLVACYAEALTLRWVGASSEWFDMVLPQAARLGSQVRTELLFAYGCLLLKTHASPPRDLARLAASTLKADLPPSHRRRCLLAACALRAVDRNRTIELASQVRGDASAAGELHLAVVAQVIVWRTTRELGLSGVDEQADRVVGLAERGGPLLLATVLSNFSACAHDPSRQLQLVGRLVGGAVDGLPSVQRHLRRDAAFAQRALGDFEAASEHAESAVSGFLDNGDRGCAAWMLEILSLRAERNGDLAEAASLAERARAHLQGSMLWTGFSPLLLGRIAALHVARDELDQAQLVLTEIERATSDTVGPFHRPISALGGTLVALAEHDPRGERLAQDTLRSAAAGPSAATAFALVAVALSRRAGEEARAARLLGAAAALAERRGTLTPWPAVETLAREARATLAERIGGQRVEQLEREGGSMPLSEAARHARLFHGASGRPASGWESLTAAENKVVDLVAQGLSNRTISEQLSVSVRTVTTHLTHVYTKLGFRSRGELAVAAPRRSTRQSVG
jgi:predicted ATPase/DNA-binding CsgD family transcriptional regulator